MLSLRALLILATAGSALWMVLPHAASATPEATVKAKAFVERFSKQLRPLDIAGNRAWWDANITGKDEDFKRKEDAQNKIDAAALEQGRLRRGQGDQGSRRHRRPGDQTGNRRHLPHGAGKAGRCRAVAEDDALANAVEKKFNTFRAKVDGKELTDAEVRKILKDSKLSDRRQEVWEASKEVGKRIAPELQDLVKLRNEAAKQLGFDNYHALQLYLNEQNGDDLIKLFDRLDELTREPFARAKAEIDAHLAKNCGVAVKDLMPWHYHDPFFQEVPAVFKADLDKIYAQQDLIKLCRDFYRGIDLPIDLVIERTNNDFAPHKGKNPHAFCTDMTRDGADVRVLANVVPNDYWMSTLLHEFGHSVYSSINIPAQAAVCAAARIAHPDHRGRGDDVREAVEAAGLAGEDGRQGGAIRRRSTRPAAKMLRYQLLIFSRWCQVMLRFEKGMYENPEQDLNKLWWDMVEKYQLVQRPPGRNAPDYGDARSTSSAPRCTTTTT